jgi:hypothetical protein
MSTTKTRWGDGGVYALILAGIYLLVGVLFFYGGKSKIIDGHGMPDGLKKQFSGTFLNTIPGLDAAWTILGIFESLIFILIVISLLRFEFKPDREKTWLLRGLALAIFTFAVLGVGQNVIGENSGVAELYLYAGATGVLIGLVLNLPPYRGER